MLKFLSKIYRIFVQILCIPIFVSDYFKRQSGSEYRIGFWTKLAVLYKMARNNCKIVSGSSFLEHVTMATTIMNIPKTLEGVVVECGSYKGVSAANLSLICALCDRKLEIFDSFQGLPEPSVKDNAHTLLSTREIHTYEKGSWCGTLDEVRQSITRYGRIDVCNFNQGYFDQTLPKFKKKCVFAWLDVDLRESLETCIKNLWPLLHDGCSLYTHEAAHLEIASLFFSSEWWKENLNTLPPGLVGAGSGIGIKILSGAYFNSSMGYTIKNPKSAAFREVPQLGGLKLGVKTSLQLASPEKTKSAHVQKQSFEKLNR